MIEGFQRRGLTKSEAACDCVYKTPRRPLVWIDDEMQYIAPEIQFRTRPNNLLVNCRFPGGFRFSGDDIKRINRFLKS